MDGLYSEIWCGKNKIWQRPRHVVPRYVVPCKAQSQKLLQVFSPRCRTEWILRQLKGSQQGQFYVLDNGPQRSISVFCSSSFNLFFVIHIFIRRQMCNVMIKNTTTQNKWANWYYFFWHFTTQNKWANWYYFFWHFMNKVALFHHHFCVGSDMWYKRLYGNERT